MDAPTVTGASELIPSSHLLDTPDELRAVLEAQGYLYLPGLLPSDDVLRVRRAILECCRAGGWLNSDAELLDGRVVPGAACVEPEPAFLEVYRQVQRQEAFHTFAHHSALLDLIERVLGEPGLPHPAKIARLSFPRNVAHTTPAHQDFPFIQGSARTFTTWIPLGECPRELGGLQVNAGTHLLGVRQHHLSLGAGAMGIDPSTLPDRWHTTDYHPGDVLLFHSHTVHRAMPNVTPDRLRLSVDYRFQARSQPIAEGNLRPRTGQITWPEVYRDWRSKDLQYYWQELDLNVVGHDPSFSENRDREAFERAAHGDPVARPALLRIAQRDPGPATRARAQQALDALERTVPQTKL